MTYLPNIPVMFVMASGGVAGAEEAFEKLKSAFKSLRGRKFYGAYQQKLNIYRACVAVRDVDNPKALGIDQWVIPCGKYMRRKIMNWKDHLSEIGTITNGMAEENEGRIDYSRPIVEYYHSEEELILYLPIK